MGEGEEVSPIIGKRARDYVKREGTVIWIGATGSDYYVYVVLLYDNGTMAKCSIGDVTILGPVGDPYR